MAGPVLAFTVEGDPVAQGSKVAVPTKAGPRTKDANESRLRPWRQAVAAEAQAELGRQGGNVELPLLVEGPVAVHVTFTLARPKSHYGTGRNARKLRTSAPWYAASRPDVDKLLRAVLDALTGIAYRDDGQVASVRAGKVYGPRAQVHVEVVTLPHARASA